MSIKWHDVEETLRAARQRLLDERGPRGTWVGELSSSALSTATAVCALAVSRRAAKDEGRNESPHSSVNEQDGLRWLVDHQNIDGGWGDTIDSPSNISTTILCWAALAACESSDKSAGDASDRGESWIRERAGGVTPLHLTKAVAAVYGADKTFAVPILTMCALAGRFGSGRGAWRHIPSLPFELAACPHQWFRWLGLTVVSYALPALIAIGQARHHHRPSRNPITRIARGLLRQRTLRKLLAIQPESGGYLEATPLTSFVVMSLASIGQLHHPVTRRGLEFLTNSMRSDGSWPIDTDLSTWVTTLAIGALSGRSDLADSMTLAEQCDLKSWIVEQQYAHEHAYTHAAPGGWAWTDRSGGVPDADDTAGALLAMHELSLATPSNVEAPRGLKSVARLVDVDPAIADAAEAGVTWLVNLQNKDGGIPTFCRGWGKLPFDQSSPDLTAHALRAFAAWRAHMPDKLCRRIDRANDAAIRFLLDTQDDRGAWNPLWFGNQYAAQTHNPVYGTTRVLRFDDYARVAIALKDEWRLAKQRAYSWLLESQNGDGGWGGDVSTPSSIEETAMAIEALTGTSGALIADSANAGERSIVEKNEQAVERGCTWLVDATSTGTKFAPAPIGLYFSSLWYTERLYPLIFTVSALEHATRRRERAAAETKA